MAGNLLSVGNSGLTFGPMEILYSPRGMTTRLRVTCPSLGPLVAYFNTIKSAGASGRFLGLDNGTDGVTTAENKELEVEFPGLFSAAALLIGDVSFDQWELVTNESSETIFANPLIVGGGSPVLNYNAKTVLSRLARDGGTLSQAIDSCNSDITSGNLTAPTAGNGGTADGKFQKPSTGAATQLTVEILKGQTEYENPTYVLRHTSYTSATDTYNSNLANVMQIYSPAQLLTEVGSGWAYNLPTRLYSKIASIPFQSAPGDESSYYTWGWLKKITREPVLSNFIVEVSTEYELGLWSNLRYALHS